MLDNEFPFKYSEFHGYAVPEESDVGVVGLLGGHVYQGVCLTKRQVDKLCELFDVKIDVMDEKRKARLQRTKVMIDELLEQLKETEFTYYATDEEREKVSARIKELERRRAPIQIELGRPLMTTGTLHNIFRHASVHGLRMIAFLAGRGLLEEGTDPVVSMARMMPEYIEGPYEGFEDEY